MLHTLETGRLLARRDHFFHSFQNYFLGLMVVGKCEGSFTLYRDKARVHWEISPFDVWFFTSLWHDVGYSNQKVTNVLDVIYGIDVSDDLRVATTRFVTSNEQGVRSMAGLMTRLLNPGGGRTEWMEPALSSRLSESEQRMHEAIIDNTASSHGATSAIRLLQDFIGDIERLESESRNVMRQGA